MEKSKPWFFHRRSIFPFLYIQLFIYLFILHMTSENAMPMPYSLISVVYRLLSWLGFLLLVVGCRYFAPTGIEETPEAHNVKWNPPLVLREFTCGGCQSLVVPEKDIPLTSSELLDIALQNNPSTKQAWHNARSAAFLFQASKSTFYPEVNLQETLAFTENHFGSSSSIFGATGATGATGTVPAGRIAQNIASGNTLQGYVQSINSDLTMSYLLLDFGGRVASIKAAHEALRAADWTHNRTLQDVMIAVLRAYYAYINDKATVEARQDNLRDAEKSLDAANRQFESGVNTIVDVLQAKANYYNAQLQLQDAIGQRQTALGQLATAMGLPANTIFETESLPEKLPTEEAVQDMNQLMAVAKERRPDLSAAYALYRRMSALVTVARSAGLPTLNANGIVEATNFFRRSAFNSRFYQGNLALNIPIFNGFYYVNQTRSAEEQANAAYEQFKVLESNILLEVLTSYYALETSVKTIEYSEEYLSFAQKAFDAALESYEYGTQTILQLLTAQVALANARAQYVQARTQFVTALADLAYATGVM